MRESRKEMNMSSKPNTGVFQAAMAQPASEEARVEDLFNKQKAYFASDATKTYEWRIDQLDRLVRMLKDNYQRFADASCNDFKTAVQENIFEVSASIASTESTKSQFAECKRSINGPTTRRKDVHDGTLGSPKVPQYGRALWSGARLIECSRFITPERRRTRSDWRGYRAPRIA
jgi:acyl-CoA reductase-like NAD-dependent aldehyde dehydrogenase